ncbi:MFS general substrate transporter [Thozetella sp. PMI_491]|nr:MFS general substrate transporter [Thozetella sp. PMI_491]
MGPVLGGVFTSTIGWRWCFYINLPFGAASLVMVFFAFKQPRTPVAFLEGLRALDWGGTVLVTGGAICFLLGLETGAGGAHPWGSAMVSCLLAFGAILLALFLLYETKFAKNPLVPTRIFRSVTNVACFILTCVHSFTFISYDYFLPLYYQAVLGFSPIISGVTMLALVVTLSVVTMGGGFFVRSTGDFLTPIRTGAVLMTLGTGLFISFGSATEWAKIILFELVAGLGVGPLFQCPMIALQSHVLPEDVAMASSAMTFSRNLFTSTSIVVGSVILQRALGAGSLTPGTGESEASNAAAVADKEEYASALRIMWIFYTCMSSLMVIASFFVKKRNLLQKQAEPTSPESIGEKGDPEKAQQWPTVAK